MKKKRFSIGIGIGIFLAIVMAFNILGPETVSAEECQLIKITSLSRPSQATAVDPQTLEASQGVCVLWANLSKDQIKIRFLGSQDCIVNPVGFECDEGKKSFVTSYFRRGESKSLQIVKAGTYHYEIKAKTEPSAITTGTIIVK